jgi:uncharacterized protein (DUF433 family)
MMVGMSKGVAVLQRELYTEPQAARLLGIPAATLDYWLEGGIRKGKTYAPILRPEPLGRKTLTWGEFVEAGYLREYRKNIPMAPLRAFIEILRDRFGVPYPLATIEPFKGPGRKIVLDAQKAAKLPPSFWLHAPASAQQLLPLPAVAAFLDKVDFADELDGAATRLHPLGKRRPVVFDPDYSFGEPTVEGIRTEVLVELYEAGESIAEIAATYDLKPRMIRAAIAYELEAAA